MELFDAIYERRSVRNFVPEPVPHDDLQKIVQAGIEAPSGCNAQLRQYIIVDQPDLLEPLRPFSMALATCPAAVVLLVDPQATKFGEFWVQDASAAIQNMLLAATALGYGACWVEGALRRHEEQAREVLGVPASLRIWAMIPVGRAADKPPRPPKSDPAEVIHHNTFTSVS
jgi:nitroreductase